MSKVFVSNLPSVMIAIEGGTQKSIRAATFYGRNEIIKGLSGQRKGKRYKVPGTSRYYTASAPGEYPAVATGRLFGSPRAIVKGDTGYVYTNVEHVEYLEDPKHKGYASARPFFKTILEKATPEMRNLCYGAGNPASRRWF